MSYGLFSDTVTFMFTSSELVILAETYCAAERISLAALGDLIFGNHKFFKLLVAGKGAHSHNAERAADWFHENWPEGVDWPVSVRDRRPAAEPAQRTEVA